MLKKYHVLRLTVDLTVFALVFYLSLVIGSFSLSLLYKAKISQANNALNIRVVDQAGNESINQRILGDEKSEYTLIYRPEIINFNSNIKRIAKKIDFVPLGGQPYEQVHVCDEGYGLITDTMDRMGLRNKDSIWDDVKNINILLVGDSLAFGECTTRQNNISSNLEKSGWLVANLGIGGSSPPLYSALQKTFIPKVKPQFVVTVFNPNDRSDTRGDIFYQYYGKKENIHNYLSKSENSLFLSEKYKVFFQELEQQKILESGSTVSIINYTKAFIKRIYYSRHWALDGYKPFLKHLSKSSGALDRGTKYAIDNAISLCLAHNCSPIFVFVPNHPVLDPNPFASQYREQLSDYILSKNQILVDTTNQVRALGSAGHSPFGLHPSPKTYGIISDLLVAELYKLKK